MQQPPFSNPSGYGAPGFGPPGPGGPGFGAPGGWGPGGGPSGFGPDPRRQKLDSDSTMWLVIAIASWFIGVGFLTGPICWWKGSSLRRDYRSLGLEPSGSATGAWVIGIVSTGLFVLAVFALIALFTFFGLAVVGTAAAGSSGM